MTATAEQAPARASAPAPPAGAPSRRAVTLVAATTGLLWTTVLLVRLLAGGAVGMGDQGDSRRLMCQLGVRVQAPYDADRSAYLYPTWISHDWYGEACTADAAGGVYRSSELALLALAKHLTPLLGLPGTLDLRALGVVCAVLTGLLVAALVAALPGGLLLRTGVASLVGLLAADSAVAQYFISPYSEAAGLLGLLALCPALLLLWRRGRTTWPALAAVGFLAAFTLGAKSQTAALLPALAAAILWVPHYPERRWLPARAPGLVLTSLLLVLAAYFATTSPAGFSQQNVYGSVFGTILPLSPDPEQDLRDLGADPSLADAAGTSPETPGAATQRLEYLEFRERVSASDVLVFYATHPGRLLSTAQAGLRGMTRWRQDYLGSYLPTSGQPPRAIESRVHVYGSLFQDAPRAGLLLFWIGTIYIGLRTACDRRLLPSERGVGNLALFLAFGAFAQFWTVMLVAGFPDVYKHMIFTNLLLALGLPVMLCCLVLRRRARKQRAVPPTGVG